MVEANHKKFKYGWLLPAGPLSFEEIVIHFAIARECEEFCNRPNGVLFGLSPAEVRADQIPDPARFKAFIAQARQYSARPLTG